MTALGLTGVIHALGWRNVAYVALTLALVLLAAGLNGAGSLDPRGDPGTLGAVLLWAVVSVPFVPVNAVLLVRDLLRGREDGRALQALLACVVAAASGRCPEGNVPGVDALDEAIRVSGPGRACRLPGPGRRG